MRSTPPILSACLAITLSLISCTREAGHSPADIDNEDMSGVTNTLDMTAPTTDSGRGAPQPDEGADLDAPDFEDPFCHTDCFGVISCEEDKVYVMAHSPIPCSEGSTCPETLEYTCEQGCAIEHVYPGTLDIDTHGYVILCNEFPGSRVGHACQSDLDCPAPLPEEMPDGSVKTPVYLECVENACAERPAVEVVDYLAPCELTIESTYIGEHAAIEASACSEGLCLIGPPAEGASCIPQGCTRSCQQDADCPGGSLCVKGAWYDDDPDRAPGAKYCKPGAREAFGRGLQCP